MKKNWFKILLVAALLVAGLLFLVRYKKNGGDIGELAGQAVQVLTDSVQNESSGDQVLPVENASSVPLEEVTVTQKEEGFLVSVKGEEDHFYKKDAVKKDGTYDSRDKVAIYLYRYKSLPSNYITKTEAKELGWQGGGLDSFAKGKSIGGDRFGNFEGLLPKTKGRQYTECDIDTKGKKSRGAKRLVFSNDGLIYYTSDHYENFTELSVKEAEE